MTTSDERTVSVERMITAAPEMIFAVLQSPARHTDLDGSDMLRGDPDGPAVLGLGDEFSMAMQQRGQHYRSVSRVVEFEQDRLISWESTGRLRGRKIIGGQWWRFELIPDAGQTLVRHSYLWGKAMLATLTIRLPGFPRKMAQTMPDTLARLDHAVTAA